MDYDNEYWHFYSLSKKIIFKTLIFDIVRVYVDLFFIVPLALFAYYNKDKNYSISYNKNENNSSFTQSMGLIIAIIHTLYFEYFRHAKP